MKLLLKFTASFLLFSLSINCISAEGWNGSYHKISKIDTVQAENFAYLTLENYQNTVCSNHRIALWHPEQKKFEQMFSIVLSAFHSGARIQFYFPDTSNCTSTRIMMIK